MNQALKLSDPLTAATERRALAFFWLLLSLVALILLTPIIEIFELRRWPAQVLLAIVSLATIHALGRKRRQVAIAGIIAVVALLLNGLSLATELTSARIAADCVYMAFLFFIVALTLVPILKARQTDFDILCGAVAVYLMLGVAWALSYRIIATVVTDAFTFSAAGGDSPWYEFLYFSFTTLTTLGYGDMTGLHPVARIWSTFEAITGSLYIAVLVARLVSLYRN